MNKEDFGIIQSVNFSLFCDSFSDTYKNNFSYDGKRALFDYLEEMARGMGENIELDPIALCCEYTEYETFADFQEQYPHIKDMEELNEMTQVIEIDNAMKSDNFIIANF